MEKKEVNLSEIDANFVISSFKNKERRNNPSSIPRALYPPAEIERMEKEKEKEKRTREVSDTATVSDEPDKADTDSAESKSGSSGNGDTSNADNAVEGTTIPTGNAKRNTARQQKAAFEEYQELFLKTPKIVNRKPVFISESTRDRLKKIAKKLGDDNMSASGFLENLALHHLHVYEEDIEIWRKL